MSNKETKINYLMEKFPDVKLEPKGKDHARYALVQGLIIGDINCIEYEDLIDYVTFKMFSKL